MHISLYDLHSQEMLHNFVNVHFPVSIIIASSAALKELYFDFYPDGPFNKADRIS
ncbi:MAG: hypothetical protein CM1200mP28_15520 [Deltaproteobacteria bacterium]|nr:MAG: hypothetical protein CM1200mP28_15520 [Deltaproteobacteria bacterium]